MSWYEELFSFLTGLPTESDLRTAKPIGYLLPYWGEFMTRSGVSTAESKNVQHEVNSRLPGGLPSCPAGFWQGSDGACLKFTPRDGSSGLGQDGDNGPNTKAVVTTVVIAGVIGTLVYLAWDRDKSWT
jgi:hypothetical protein